MKHVASFRQYQAAYVGGQLKIGNVIFGRGVSVGWPFSSMPPPPPLPFPADGSIVGRGLIMARLEQASLGCSGSNSKHASNSQRRQQQLQLKNFFRFSLFLFNDDVILVLIFITSGKFPFSSSSSSSCSSSSSSFKWQHFVAKMGELGWAGLRWATRSLLRSFVF